MSKWAEETCGCGETFFVHEDWDNPPDECEKCREAKKAKWHEQRCTDCGETFHIHEDWENPPSACKECREKRKAKWHEERCPDCGNMFSVHEDWEHPPKYCPDCKGKYQAQELQCTICDSSFTWTAGAQRKAEENGWSAPKKCPDCRKLLKETVAREVLCKYCPNTIEWSPFQQLMELHKGWARPTICRQCKEDRYLLIQGALSDFSEKVYVKDEQPVGSEKFIAVVYRARDSQELAHVSIGHKFGEGRVAITVPLGGALIPEQRRRTKTESKFGEGRSALIYGNKGNVNRTSTKSRFMEKPAVVRTTERKGSRFSKE
ncbi:MAG: zinc-ribbon domain containing protein [Candidatus Paceibacterota bacterium]